MGVIVVSTGIIAGIVMMLVIFHLPLTPKDRRELEEKLEKSQGIKRKWLAVIYTIDNHRSLSVAISLIGTILIFARLFSTAMFEQGTKNAVITFFTGYMAGVVITAVIGSFYLIVSELITLFKKGKVYFRKVFSEYKSLTRED